MKLFTSSTGQENMAFDGDDYDSCLDIRLQL